MASLHRRAIFFYPTYGRRGDIMDIMVCALDSSSSGPPVSSPGWEHYG